MAWARVVEGVLAEDWDLAKLKRFARVNTRASVGFPERKAHSTDTLLPRRSITLEVSDFARLTRPHEQFLTLLGVPLAA